jgi:hypothetical protein
MIEIERLNVTNVAGKFYEQTTETIGREVLNPVGKEGTSIFFQISTKAIKIFIDIFSVLG